MTAFEVDLGPPNRSQSESKRKLNVRSIFERFSTPNRNLAIKEREAREARDPQALQATQEQREQQEGQEQERQHQEGQQRKSGKSSPSINTASVHYRLGREHHEEQQRKSDQRMNRASVYYRVNPFCPCSPAARARRAVGAGNIS